MFRRSLSLLLTIVIFASMNVGALVSAQADTQLVGSSAVSHVTAELQGRLGLESVAAFDATGGWAVIAPNGNNPELFFYLGTDPIANELSGVRRPVPVPHPAGTFVAALDASQFRGHLDGSSSVDVVSVTSGVNSIESIALVSAAAFYPAGGFAVADATTSAPSLFYYSSADAEALVLGGIQAPSETSLAISTSVTAVDVAGLFPLVIDPPPVTVPGVDPPPTTVDPPPVGGQDLGALIPDPPPTTVDPPPVGGQDLGGLIADPPPTTVNPPPVGGQDLGGLIADPPPTTVDPPPVGGQDVGGVIADPPPVTVDPPPVGPYTVEPLNPDPIYVAIIDPTPIAIDPPPYAINGVDDPAPVVVDAPPYAINGADPAPVYLDAAPVQVPGADPAPVTYDPAPQTVTFPDPPPVGGTYVNPPAPGTVTYDPPPAGGTYVNPPTVAPIAIDAPPVGGGVIYIPDSDEICAPDVDIAALIAELIGPINLPPLPPITTASTILCFDPSDGVFVPIPAVDAPPVSVAVPDPCPGTSGCYVPQHDLGPVSVAVPDLCTGYGCYVPKIDQPAPAPIYLNPDAISFDAPAVAARTVDPAPVFADPAPVPGATGNPAAITIADPGPVPGATGNPAAIILDPPALGGFVVDPPPLCDSYSDPANGPSCTVPRVDASPLTVDLPHPCSQVDSMVCTLPVVDQSPLTVDLPHPCSQVDSMVCTVPVVDQSPLTVDLPHPCSQVDSMVCTVPVVDQSPLTVDLPHPCSQVDSMVCTVPVVDQSPLTVDLPHPCSQVDSMVCTVPVVDQSPLTVDLPQPCGQVGSTVCTAPVVDAPPVTVDLSATCTLVTAAGGSCTIDPSPVATVDPSPLATPCGSCPPPEPTTPAVPVVAPDEPSEMSPTAGAFIRDTTPAFSATYKDSELEASGHVEFEVFLAGTKLAEGRAPAVSDSPNAVSSGGRVTWQLNSPLEDRTYAWKARSCSALGCSEWTLARELTVDTTPPPAPAFRDVPSDPSNDATPEWTFGSLDDSSGTSGFQCSMLKDGVALSGWASCSSPHGRDLSSSGPARYDLLLREFDAAGNMSPTSTASHVFDPAVFERPTITQHPEDPTARGVIQFSFIGPSTASLECDLKRGATVVVAFKVCTSPVSYDLSAQPDGVYTFQVEAVGVDGSRSAAASESLRVGVAGSEEIIASPYEAEADAIDQRSRASTGSRYAGSWQTYGSDRSIFLRIGIADMTILDETVTESLSTSGVRVTAVSANYSYRELAMFAETVTPIDPQTPYLVGIDVKTNQVEIEVEDQTGTATGTPEILLGAVPADAVRARWTTDAEGIPVETRSTYTSYKGGRRWSKLWSETERELCTAAFTVVLESGRNAGLTAGHCAGNDTNAWSGSKGEALMGEVFRNQWFGDAHVENDSALIRIDQHRATDRLFISPTLSRQVTSVDRDIRDGEEVCISGQATGISCGRVVSSPTNVRAEGEDPHVWEHTWCASFDVDFGDSGAPAYRPVNWYDADHDETYRWATALGMFVFRKRNTPHGDIGCFEPIRQIEEVLNVRVRS